MFVKPGINKATGKPLVIRIPHTYALMQDTGIEVPSTAFWLRRLRDGDVVKAAPPAPAIAPMPPKAELTRAEAA